MKILILSDSHYKDIDIKNKYDYIFHLGDYGYSMEYLDNNNIIYVKGNCDYLGDKERIIEINNKKLFLTHGDKYRVKESYNSLYFKALSINANIVLFGHTHYQEVFIENNILFINPGAYKDGYYVIMDNNYIYLYLNDYLIKKIDYR